MAKLIQTKYCLKLTSFSWLSSLSTSIWGNTSYFVEWHSRLLFVSSDLQILFLVKKYFEYFTNKFVMVHCAPSLCLTSHVFTLCFDSLSKYLFVPSSFVLKFWHRVCFRLLFIFASSYSFCSDFVLFWLLCLNIFSSYNFGFVSHLLDSLIHTLCFSKALLNTAFFLVFFIHLLCFQS